MGLAETRLLGARDWLRAWHELVDPIPEPTPELAAPTRLCVGMATYDDFDGAWFTIASVLLYHPEVRDHVSFVVVDNLPTSRVSASLKGLETRFPRFRYVPFRAYRGTSVRDIVFREAQADIVCCLDSHVLLRPGALAALIRYFDARPGCRDLVQGPLISACETTEPATHFEPEWGASAFGRWGHNELSEGYGETPYELDSQGLGVFACRKDAWPGFNPLLRGYGSEEGYLHERVRRAGGRTVGLPALAWVHRFQRPHGAPYPNVLEARLRNYEVGWDELGWDLTEGRAHFAGKGLSEASALTARQAVSHPLNVFDAIMVLNDDTDPQGWAAAMARAAKGGYGWRAERVSMGKGESSERGWIAGLRQVVMQASKRALRNVLVLDATTELDVTSVAPTSPEADVRFLGDAIVIEAPAFDWILAGLPDEGETSAWLLQEGGVRRWLRRMAQPASRGRVTAQAYGVDFTLGWSGVPEAAVRTVLPPLSRARAAHGGFVVEIRAQAPGWQVQVSDAASQHPGPAQGDHHSLDEALAAAQRAIAMQVGLLARERVFVHAGVVGVNGEAIVLPGPSYAGKSTLVHALVERGCTYLSDEYAVLDATGHVHPYPRPISLRTATGRTTITPVSSALPMPVAAVAALRFKAGAQPCIISVGRDEAAMSLIGNALAARTRPAEVLRASAAAVAGAVTWTGIHGDASVVADMLLDRLRRR